MGVKHPNDLITAILDDHEQSKLPSTISSPAQPSHPTRRRESLPVVVDSRNHGESEAEMMSLVGRHLNRSRADSESVLTMKQSHLKPTATASKCAAPDCRKKFVSAMDRRRNCCMCGKVFCRRCTNYRRRLSMNAQPDSFGTFNQVCHICFDHSPEFGMERDLMRSFGTYRRELITNRSISSSEETKKPICVQKSSVQKRDIMKTEMLKLVEGFGENSGWIKGIMAELKIPAWQKLPQWVEASAASHCFHCGNPFRTMARKLNCRVGGQVVCSNCCQDEIVIFSDGEEIKWAVNGKPGGPRTTPSHFKLMPVCRNCSSDLQIALLDTVRQPASTVSNFLDHLHKMHQHLSTLEAKIESCLPEYQKVVDTLDMVDSSPQSVQGRHPLQVLVKVQSDLSDAFSTLAVESQKLKTLKPETSSEGKLHRHVMIGTYQYYSENMFHFRLTKNRLGELMPTDHLEEIQLAVSQQSMERVHIIMQQLMYEVLNLEKHYEFNSDFFSSLIKVIGNIESEFQPFMEQRKESWKKHCDLLMVYVQMGMKEGRTLIKLQSIKQHGMSLDSVRYIIVSQCASRIHECYRELNAKTINREFYKTKESLYAASSELDEVLVRMNAVYL